MREPIVTRSFTGTEARLLLRRARTGTLASLNRDGGIPYGSLVNLATDVDGRPIILISGLAWHTQNLLADSRASLLVAEPPERGDALTGARATIMGRFQKCDEVRLRRRYLARHPEAQMYVDFGDFAFWRLEAERVHAVAGFGRIETLPAVEVFAAADEMIALEDSAIAHMNEDHAEAVRLYASRLLGAEDGDWKVAAIDCDGVGLVLGDQSLRLAFPQPVFTAVSLRQCLSTLAATAKAKRPF
jgi:heme iron utilization protein